MSLLACFHYKIRQRLHTMDLGALACFHIKFARNSNDQYPVVQPYHDVHSSHIKRIHHLLVSLETAVSS